MLNIEKTIYYFTGTGNSLKIAKDLSGKLGNCNIVSIAKNIANVNMLSPKEIVGFVFPVFYCGMPKIVKEFIQKINLSSTSYIFLIAVYGANLGNAGCIHQGKNILKKKSIRLDSAFYVKSVDNFVIWTWDVPSNEKQHIIHKMVDKRVEDISGIIKNKKTYFDKSITEYVGPVIFKYKNFLKTVNNRDKTFIVGNNCNTCGICVKICPVKNIKINNKPEWLNNCQFCLACYHMCPNKAINYGKVTFKRQRYSNPYNKMEEYYND